MKGIRLVGFVLVMLLVVSSGIAFAEQEDGSEPDPALSAAPVADPGTEIVADRTANSETFRLPGGERETRVYAEPVHYNDGGEWQPIGSALRESEDGAALTNGENDFEVTLPQQLDSDPARISFGEQWISSQLLGTNTEAVELEGKTAAYESVQGNVAISYSGLANGLKEDIELGDSSQPSSFTFALDASSGLTPALTEAGDLEFRDKDDQPVAILPAPLMYDSAPEHPATSRAIHYELEPASGSWRLKVEADREWLNQPERVWPVHLDPSTVKLSPKEIGNYDCAIGGKKGSKNAATCGSKGIKELPAAYWPKANSAEDEWSRLLLYFNLNNAKELPDNAYVNEATLSMRASEAALNTSGVELGLVEKKAMNTGGVNWTNWNMGQPWSNEGGDYSQIVGKVTTAERGSAAGWWNLPLAVKPIMEFAENKNAEEPVPPRRILLLGKLIDDKSRECAGSSCTQRQIKFESSAATNAENRPYLSLKYFMPAPAAAKLASPMDGTQSARRFRLKARWEAGVTGVTFQYRKGSKGRFDDIPLGFVKDAEGKALTKWPMAVEPEDEESKSVYLDTTALEPKYKTEEGKLQLRTLFIGGTGYDGYSTPSNVIVNPDIGGTGDATEAVGPGSVDLLTGNYTVSRTDFTIPAPIGSVAVSRTHNSRDSGPSGDTGVFGRGWQPTSTIEAAGTDWRSVREFSPTYEEAAEGLGGYVHLTDLKGVEHTFEKEGETYFSPPEMQGWQLTHATGASTFTLSDSQGNKTVFSNAGAGTEYLPISITTTGTGDNSAKYVYELVNGKRRLKTMVAAGGALSCSETAKMKTGCHALEFSYKPATTWGGPAAYGDRLATVTYWGPESGNKQFHWEVVKYEYDSAGRLIAEWDPRLASPLKETYTYVAGGAEAAGQLRTLDPPGQEPWTFEYKALSGEKAEAGRLSTVKRPSLVASPSTAQTTIAYGVPLSGGSGAPNMTLGEIAKWGQEDLPVDATAIFGPDEVPASPPSSYSRATIIYMDAEGTPINTATPAGAGTSAPSITTVETDEFGNVIRELTPQNRLRALEAGAGSAAKSRELDFKFKYSKDGTELQEEWGPLHQVRLQESGETKPARLHTLYGYDKGWNKVGLQPHLLTTQTSGAWIKGEGKDADQRVTETKYDWDLRQPIETIVDPGGLELKTVVVYDKETGQVTERRTPGGEKAGDANTTKIKYYSGGPNSGGCVPKGPITDGYTGLPCEISPGGQPGGGLPELLVTKYTTYNSLGQPTEVIESLGGKEETTRKTITTYDSAGRVETSRQIGGGKELPPTKTIYNSTTGLPVERTLSCESCDTQAVVVAYDKLGRPVKYTDADGSTSETTYDLLGRPATIFDGKGTQKFGYDSTSGLLTKLEDSAAGTFTAAYDADGNMVERGLPNGLVAKTTYDEVGAPTKLSYTKTSCTECTWPEESNERSIYGQILSQTSLASSQQYSYDQAGRLELVKDTPQGGGCTTRKYEYDRDSNRKALLTRAPGGGGVCDTKSAVTPQEYTYDAADRLTDPEIAYDPFGRITSLPGKYAGGSALSTTFYSNDMIATQSQAGLTNTYQLDAEGRPRQVVQTGTKTGTEVLHYALASDSTAWTERSGTWTRNIMGIGGELAAIQESSGTTSLQLANLHGDIVATASLSLSAKEPTSNREFDEFGNPKKGSAGRYGWLGGKSRRTELPSGVTQMGVRSYIPALGRFLSPDPVEGGSANAYDYADQDPVNGLDLDGRVSGCGVEVWAFSENHRIYSYADYNCNSGAWPFGHSLIKVEVRFERHTKGWWDETFIGEFETKGHAVWSPSNPSDPKWRHLKLRENYRCGDLGREYRITYILTVKYSSPVNGVVASSTEEVKGSGRVKCLR